MRWTSFWVAALFALPAVAAESFSSVPIPDCENRGRVLTIDNQQALDWKADRRVDSGFKAQLLVEGEVTQVYPRRNDHDHFIMQIGPGREDLIEVVYNNAFGDMPEPELKERVQACGEYIKSTETNGGYPPSPAGAIIHWVHKNPRLIPGRAGHDHGFVVFAGVLYGWGGEATRRRGSGFQLPDWMPGLIPTPVF